jgi:hypothetical protein
VVLGLRPDARLICYGSDKNFKKLERRPRKPPPPPKGPRKRPSPPEWNRFGSDERERLQMDPNSSDYIGRDQKSPPRPPRMHERLREYFEEPDDDYFDDLYE